MAESAAEWRYSHRVKTPRPCTVDPDQGHEMWNLGHSPALCADLLACPCGYSGLGMTDEHRARYGTDAAPAAASAGGEARG